jgi:predicted metal-binding protein
MLDLKETAKRCGYAVAEDMDPAKLEFLPEVREMCAAGRCQKYDTNWACPPACGTLEAMAEKAKHFSKGILIQTIGDVEDSFDFEAMAEISKQNETNFNRLVDALIDAGVDCWPMTAGTCTRCKQCTYPDAPCRFPNKLFPSMEACGLVVSKVCSDAGVPYYYGSQKLAYTGCVLYND